MFQIKKDNAIIEMQGALLWVRDQDNEVIISCDEKNGKGILSADQSTIYSVVGKPQLRDFEFIEIEEVDLYPIVEQQRADVDYIAIMMGVDLSV